MAGPELPWNTTTTVEGIPNKYMLYHTRHRLAVFFCDGVIPERKHPGHIKHGASRQAEESPRTSPNDNPFGIASTLWNTKQLENSVEYCRKVKEAAKKVAQLVLPWRQSAKSHVEKIVITFGSRNHGSRESRRQTASKIRKHHTGTRTAVTHTIGTLEQKWQNLKTKVLRCGTPGPCRVPRKYKDRYCININIQTFIKFPSRAARIMVSRPL